MNINHLQYIVMIAQERNITKAAEKLYISQSSLSYTLSAVEKEIGQPLFFRHKYSVAQGTRFSPMNAPMYPVKPSFQPGSSRKPMQKRMV